MPAATIRFNDGAADDRMMALPYPDGSVDAAEMKRVVQERVRPRQPAAADGTVSYVSWTNAINGRKPGGA